MPEVTPPKTHTTVPRDMPKFEMRSKTAAENVKSPQYMEIMNGMNQEEVFQKILAQPVTLSLGDILGTSYEMGR